MRSESVGQPSRTEQLPVEVRRQRVEPLGNADVSPRLRGCHPTRPCGMARGAHQSCSPRQPASWAPVPGEPAYNLRMAWGPTKGTVGTVVHLTSTDPCPVVAGIEEQVIVTVTANGHWSFGGGGSTRTDHRGAWATAVRFTDIPENGPNAGIVPPKNPPQEPPPVDGTRYSVIAFCRATLGLLGQGQYQAVLLRACRRAGSDGDGTVKGATSQRRRPTRSGRRPGPRQFHGRGRCLVVGHSCGVW